MNVPKNSFLTELDSIVQVLAQKCQSADVKNVQGDRVYARIITINGRYGDETSQCSVMFLNKQVFEQDDATQKPDRGRDISLPDGDGSDVL